MEVLEKPTTKYIDLNQYEAIPALDKAIAEPSELEVFNTFEEYKAAVEKWKEEWDAEDD